MLLPSGDIVKVFYMCGEELLLAGGRVEVDTARRSHYGSSFLTLATTVDTPAVRNIVLLKTQKVYHA